MTTKKDTADKATKTVADAVDAVADAVEKLYTISAYTDTLTGFEELAIAKHFGADYFSLPFSRRLRSLAMVMRIRDGQPGPEAYKAVMGMKQGDVADLFADDDTEADTEADSQLDNPTTEAGKGDGVTG